MRQKYWYLILLAILSLITYLDRNAISIAGIDMTRDLGMSEIQFGWVLAAFTISYGLFEIPTGLMGDRWGEKKTLTRIVIWWSVFTAFTGLTGGFLSLFIIRFLFGAGEAGAFPNMSIAAGKWFGPEERGRAQAVILMASRVGGAITPFMVIPLQTNLGWRNTFYILGLIGMVWVVLWLFFYNTKKVGEVKKSERSWGQIAHTRNFWFLMLFYYCYASGVFFFISWLPKYLHHGRGIPQEDLAYAASLPFILAAIGCLFGGSLSDMLVKKIGVVWGRRIIQLVGLSLSGLSILTASITNDLSVSVVMLALGLAFMDVTAPVSWAVATGLGKHHAGAVTGAMNTAGLLGGTVASLGIGYLISWTNNYELPVQLIGGHMILGALLTLGIKAES